MMVEKPVMLVIHKKGNKKRKVRKNALLFSTMALGHSQKLPADFGLILTENCSKNVNKNCHLNLPVNSCQTVPRTAMLNPWQPFLKGPTILVY
jgi:hypothetical protein